MLTDTHSIFDTKIANKMVDEMNSDEYDTWVYKVINNPKNEARSIIAIYDEENEFVGYL